MVTEKLDKSNLQADLAAGFTFAAVNVPQGMANAVLATVNPLFGLYTLMIATPVGALLTGSVFMNVSTTSALSAATASALVGIPEENKTAAFVTVVLIMGLFQLVLGLFKLGWLIRFVPNSVMTGFINGVAVTIILGQLADLTGYHSNASNRVFQAIDLVFNLNQIQPAIFGIGLLTLVSIVILQRTRFKNYAMLIGLLLATLVTWLLKLDMVPLVNSLAEIPRSLPRPQLPTLYLDSSLLLSAVALGIVGLVQGAGVSQAYPNPNGKYPDASRDFLGQGAANIATSLVQGIPVGGSMSGSALTVQAGQRSRWANIFAGGFVAVIVLLFANLVELIPLTALAALLIIVGYQLLKIDAMVTVWKTGRVPAAAMLITFVTTLFVPLQYAVLTGVAVSILLDVFQDANKVTIVELVPMPDGFPEETPAPKTLPSDRPTVLMLYGSAYFAAASTLESLLPEVDNTHHAVAIIVLRGRAEVGSTFLGVIRRYADALRAKGSLLMLAGVDDHLYHQLERTGLINTLGHDNVFKAQKRLGVSAQAALTAANKWLAETSDQQETPNQPSK